jgi:integrase
MIEQNKQKKDKTLFLKKLGIETDLEGRVKIDQTTMKKLKPIPHGNQYKTISVSDSLLMGFRARVNPGGSKTFIYRFRPKDPGQSVQEKQTITIGTWYDNSDPRFKDKIGMTPTVARNLAKDMIIKIAKKEDPYSIVKAKRKGRTFFSVYTDWIEKRVPSSNFKASSRKDYISRFNTYVKLNSKLERHKKLYRLEADAFKLIKSEYKNITKDDYIMRLVEQYAIEIGVLEKRICIFGKKELNKENSRLDKEDPYTVSEMKRYRAAALSLVHEEKTKQQENPNYKQNHRLVPCYSLLAVSNLGGRSKSMILCLEWEQIDFKNKVIRFMDTKNNEPIVLDYDYKFAAILRVMRRHQKTIHAKDKRYKYVFPSLDKKFKCKHINDVRRTHQTIIEKAKLPYKVIHFLRHTWATTVYEATGDVLAVKEMGGWKSLEAVQKYTQVSRQQRRNKLKQIRNYVSSNSHVKRSMA